jgi:hypothetical protein
MTDTPKTPKEVMLAELQGQLRIVKSNRRRIEIEGATLDGEESALNHLISRLESGLVNLDTGVVRY